MKHSLAKAFCLSFLLIANTSVYSMDEESDNLNGKKSHTQLKESPKNEFLEKKEESKKLKVSKYKKFEDLILCGLVGASLGGITSSKMMMENLELELKNGLSKLDTQSILMRSFDFGNTITRGGVKIILGCLLYKISTSIFDHIIQKKYIKIEIKPKTKTKTKT